MSQLEYLAGDVGNVYRSARNHEGEHHRAGIPRSGECVTCLKAFVTQLIEEDATDDDLRPVFDGALTSIPERRYLWMLVDEVRSGRKRPRSTVEPLATREQADAAMTEYGSERKAAKALGVSKTQLRRYTGKET